MPKPKQTPFEETVSLLVPGMGRRPAHKRCAEFCRYKQTMEPVEDLAPFNHEQTNLNSPQCLFCAGTLGPGKDS